MADYIFIRKSRNALSSFLHVFLNILLGVGSILVTIVSGSWLLGVVLVFLSKWRIFSVHPRFWFLNIKSNLVDLIVGISLVLLAYVAGTEILPVHYLLALIYVAWLIFIKPLSTEVGAIAQSLLAIFLGSSATILLTSSLDSILIVLIEFIIGYGASRHIFAQGKEGKFTQMTLICGLLCSEISWLCHSWMIIYPIGQTGITIPQLSLVLTVAAFSFTKILNSITTHDGELKLSDAAAPALFGIITILILVLGFSNPIFNI